MRAFHTPDDDLSPAEDAGQVVDLLRGVWLDPAGGQEPIHSRKARNPTVGPVAIRIDDTHDQW